MEPNLGEQAPSQMDLASLERPELFFQRLVDNLPAGAYMCDANGLITYYNQHALAVWGRAPKLNDSVDRYCGSFKLFASDGTPLDHNECWMALAIRNERSYNGEEIIVERPDGERLTVLAHANPIHDESGRLIGAVNMLVDVTEQKRGSQASAQLAAVVESSDDAIISKDLDGTIRSWNRAAERLFGYSSEEAVGKSITILIPEDRLDEETDILARLRRGERIEHYETIRRRKNGELLNVSLTVSPVVDASGKIVGASKISRDITEKRKAELALKEQAQTLATINRVAGTLAAELDLERLVQAITDAGTELSHAELGAFFYNVTDDTGESYTLYTLSGAASDSFRHLPMPRTTEVFRPTFQGEGVVCSDDITEDERFGKQPPFFGLPKGHPPIRSYLAAPVVARSGKVLGGLFFGHQQPGVFTPKVVEVITALASHAATAIDNAYLYEEARRLNETLEEKVEQRTRDLTSLNEELETFNYSVAHDLRGSLRGIDGFSQIVLEECGDVVPESSRHWLQRISLATQQMGDVIDKLLELSRLVQLPVVHEELCLDRIAHEAICELRERDGERHVSVEIANDLKTFGDEGLLRLLMANLIGNAWKFTSETDEARIEVGSIERGGDCVTYYVKDNGAGFDMNYADKLFRPFQRLHSPGEYDGSGIGLATVQRIINKHGGRIWAEGEPGKGATFWFTLGRD